MAHIAIINKKTLVVESVLVVDNSKFFDEKNNSSESHGLEFIKKITQKKYPELEFDFKQCSYNAKSNGFRKNYPSKGFDWSEQRDAFIPPIPSAPKPESIALEGQYILNEQTCKWEYSGKLKIIDELNSIIFSDNKNTNKV